MSRMSILSRIRDALGTKHVGDPRRVRRVADRLAASHAREPSVATGSGGETVEARLRRRLAANSAEVLDVPSWSDVPRVIVDYLGARGYPPRVRSTLLPHLDSAQFSAAGVDVMFGAASRHDTATLSLALAAIAETGSLVIASSAGNPASLAFLTEVHIVAVPRDAIVPGIEDAFKRVRQCYGHGAMPRSVTLISGPSRTGDIGGRIVNGAHGPIHLAVLLIGP